jgi:hypothetical protein
MKRIAAIARLTFWEGMRMRIVLVFLLILVFIMLRLPFALRGDETLAGRLQTFLDYSLGAVSVLLSLATVFLSCSTLANEIRNNSIHLVVTKPVHRFEILVGKWLGVLALMLVLLGLSAVTIYGFARFIQTRQETFTRDKLKVRDVVWTARAAASPKPPDLLRLARDAVRQRVQEGGLAGVTLEELATDAGFERNPTAREALRERIKELEAKWRQVPPQSFTAYEFENLAAPEREDTVVQVRFKARGVPVPLNEILRIQWMFADPASGEFLMQAPFETQERTGDTHQFLVNARAIRDGKATLLVINPSGGDAPGTTLNFEGQNSLQILYKVGTFEGNYLKALAIIFSRLAFLSAIGLFFGTFVSFPVACMGAFTFVLIGIGMPWWLEAMGANLEPEYWTASADPFGKVGPYLRALLVPLVKWVFPDFVTLNGTGLLVEGKVIETALLVRAALHTLVYGGILLLLPGWLVFRGREIAEVTVQ